MKRRARGVVITVKLCYLRSAAMKRRARGVVITVRVVKIAATVKNRVSTSQSAAKRPNKRGTAADAILCRIAI